MVMVVVFRCCGVGLVWLAGPVVSVDVRVGLAICLVLVRGLVWVSRCDVPGGRGRRQMAMFLLALGHWRSCGGMCLLGVRGGGDGVGFNGVFLGSSLGFSLQACGCGPGSSCSWLGAGLGGFLPPRRLRGGGFVSGCAFSPLVVGGVGPPYSWLGPCGLGGGVGRFLPTPGRVLGCCVLFVVALVWCRFFWMGVLVVAVRGLVVACGEFSGVLVCGVWPGRGAVPAWR